METGLPSTRVVETGLYGCFTVQYRRWIMSLSNDRCCNNQFYCQLLVTLWKRSAPLWLKELLVVLSDCQVVDAVCRQGSHEIQPADVILFEGILAFYFKPLRDLFDVRLFVDLDADTRLAMRGTCDVYFEVYANDTIICRWLCQPTALRIKFFCHHRHIILTDFKLTIILS